MSSQVLAIPTISQSTPTHKDSSSRRDGRPSSAAIVSSSNDQHLRASQASSSGASDRPPSARRKSSVMYSTTVELGDKLNPDGFEVEKSPTTSGLGAFNHGSSSSVAGGDSSAAHAAGLLPPPRNASSGALGVANEAVSPGTRSIGSNEGTWRPRSNSLGGYSAGGTPRTPQVDLNVVGSVGGGISLDDIEADFRTQVDLAVAMLKGKLFTLFGLVTGTEEAELISKQINSDRDASAAAMEKSKRLPIKRTEIDTKFRFLYEEVALRWHCQKEEFPYSHRVVKNVLADEIDRRVESEKKFDTLMGKARELSSKLKVAEELTERRRSQYATHLTQYHKELNIHHQRIADLQKRLDIKADIPHLLEGADEEDEGFRRYERDEKEHLQFMYKKTADENSLLKKSNDERQALIQSLEDELESERSEASALRREFRLYLEEQDGIDEAFKEATTEGQRLLEEEREKVMKLEEIIAGHTEQMNEQLEKGNGLQERLDAVEKELEEAKNLLATAPPPMVAETPKKNTGKGGKTGKKGGTKGGKSASAQDTKNDTTMTSTPASPLQTKDSSSTHRPSVDLGALEAAHSKVQQMAEERRIKLEAAEKQKKILHVDLEQKRTEHHDLQAKYRDQAQKLETLKAENAKKEQQAAFERNREKNFLKKKANDLQDKLNQQDELMDTKLIEMKQTEADLVNDIMVMHKQFASVEKFLHGKFGPELLQELSSHLDEDAAVLNPEDGCNTPRTLEYFKEYSSQDMQDEFALRKISNEITLSFHGLGGDSNSGSQHGGRRRSGSSPGEQYLSAHGSKAVSRPNSAGSTRSNNNGRSSPMPPGSGGVLAPPASTLKSVFARSRLTKDFIANLKDQLSKLRAIQAAEGGSGFGNSSFGSQNSLEAAGSQLSKSKSFTLRKDFRESLMNGSGTHSGSAGLGGGGSMSPAGPLGQSLGGGGTGNVVSLECEVENSKMVVEDLLSQQRQHIASNTALSRDNVALQEELEQVKATLQDHLNSAPPQVNIAPVHGLKTRHNRPTHSASSQRNPYAGYTSSSTSLAGGPQYGTSLAEDAETLSLGGRIGGTGPGGYGASDLEEIDRQIAQLCANPVDLSILQLFPGVECATPFLDMFESFIGLRRQLAQLVLVCSREMNLDLGNRKQNNSGSSGTSEENAELKKILLNEKFMVFRAIESFGSRLVTQLHKKKEDVMRRREEELERVLSTMQNLSVTHPKEVAKLARVARQSAVQRDDVNLQQAGKAHHYPKVKPASSQANAADGNLSRATRSRDRVSSAGPVQVESVMTLEIERPMTALSIGGGGPSSGGGEPKALPPATGAVAAGNGARASSALLMRPRTASPMPTIPSSGSAGSKTFLIEDTTTNAATGITEDSANVTVSGTKSFVQRRPASSAQTRNSIKLRR